MTKVYDAKMVNRLKRAEGQMRGVQKMMEAEEVCGDVVTQLTAVRNSIDKLIGLIVAENLKTTVLEAEEAGDREAKIQKAIDLIIKK
ncbi:metal-sensitive transcriptional regulator [Lactococcus termiticola]|uniref:Metal-sensitive transcriptional regulator n=1 Tax=Lactococcus termiticola TaxID=2169526 RepID=A0A2R5HDC3_9LACT|nr:metal-sensitive transcriptional regulator [Lactococcus termiticola]GBG96077.1 hypothetical protein NtB2_00181 [Lactococcus termiticola]